ncbi:MipA/OmpV family protein [Marinimicrobium sp. C2-29]|uniref:MipA/OmpV family protein n=1 Tax=Marinimicrobium sp. C2-29 TaxID=3139825 RepID=UPI0031389559
MKRSWWQCACVVLGGMAILNAPVMADEVQHELSVGLGLGGVIAPDYRGSGEYQRTISPIPYFVYTGRFFKADRDGMRSDLFQGESFEINFSASATLTPESHRTPRRDGMPSLYSTLELGPALNINLTGERINDGWMLSLPLRGVVAISANPEWVGWAVSPQVVRRWRNEERTLTFRTGPYFADQSYHRYYYQVESQYAREDRPTFDVGAGYSGWSSQLVFSQRRGDWWFGIYGRYENLSGAVFEKSPLLETKHVFNVGGGISRIFF